MFFLKSPGFTLVELLIVIAIIGVLASVIVPRLDTARESARDTKLITEFDGIIKRAQVEESRALTFDVICGTNGFTQSSDIAEIITSIENFYSTTVICNSSTERYALSAPMASSTHWCVDSAGTRKEIGSALGAGDLVCP